MAQKFYDELCDFVNEVTADWPDTVNEPKVGRIELLPAGEGWVAAKFYFGEKVFRVNLDAYGKTDPEMV